jgi:hypothetical protein
MTHVDTVSSAGALAYLDGPFRAVGLASGAVAITGVR